MNIYKLLITISFVLGIIGTIFALMIMSGSQGVIDYMFYVTYVVLFIILALVLVYVFKGLLSGNVKKTLISLGLFLGLSLISYFMSSGTDLDLQPFTDKGQIITESSSKNIGAGLIMFYALAIFAIGTMAFFGVKKQFKS